MPNLYHRRPYIVEAILWTGDNVDEVKQFIGDNFSPVMHADKYEWSDRSTLVVKTLDDTYYIGSGEYVIKYPNNNRPVISEKKTFDDMFEKEMETNE